MSARLQAGARSGVRVRAGILAPGPEHQPAEIELPAPLVVLGLLVVGQVMVTEHDAGAAVLRLQRDDDAVVPGGTAWIVASSPR